MKMFDVLGVRISAVNLDLAFAHLLEMIQTRRQGIVCVAPVSTIVDAYQDASYRDVLNKAALVTPDGMPVVWIGRRRAGRWVDRVYGPDLMLKVCDEGRRHGVKT